MASLSRPTRWGQCSGSSKGHIIYTFMGLSVLSPALKPLLTSLTLIFQAAGCKVQGKTSRYNVCMARQHRGWSTFLGAHQRLMRMRANKCIAYLPTLGRTLFACPVPIAHFVLPIAHRALPIAYCPFCIAYGLRPIYNFPCCF